MAATKASPQPKEPKKPKKSPSPEEVARTALKWEAAAALGLLDKVQAEGWGGLTAAETGRVGGLMTKWGRDPERAHQEAAGK